MIKTASFAVMHFSIAFTVVWVMTGDIVMGGAVALIEPLVNTVGYYFHEKIWQRSGVPSNERAIWIKRGARAPLYFSFGSHSFYAVAISQVLSRLPSMKIARVYSRYFIKAQNNLVSCWWSACLRYSFCWQQVSPKRMVTTGLIM